MENITEIKIEVPEGMEIDRENSTFECIKFKPKQLTYEDIQKMFKVGPGYNATIGCNNKFMYKICTYRRLLEVAEYFNGNWKPDWSRMYENKYRISFNHKHDEFEIETNNFLSTGTIYFRSKEDAEEAIRIIGKENLKILFN